jgi:hypothetical protein
MISVYVLIAAILPVFFFLIFSSFFVHLLELLLILYGFMQPDQPWYGQVDIFCFLWFLGLSFVHLFMLNQVHDFKQKVSLLEKKLPFFCLDIVLSQAFCMIASLVIWLLLFLYYSHSNLCWYLFYNWCLYLSIFLAMLVLSFMLHWAFKFLDVKR